MHLFFANVGEVPSFFSHSPQRVAILDEIVGKRVPHGSATRWNFHSRTVITVHEYHEAILECLEKIEETNLQTATINQAHGLRLKLEQPVFKFWLEFLYKIMPHVEILYKQLQKRTNDPLSLKSALANFETEISKIRENITPLEIGFKNEEGRGKRNGSENVYLSTTVAAKEVCDQIMSHCKERFEFSDHLLASTLFDQQFIPNISEVISR